MRGGGPLPKVEGGYLLSIVVSICLASHDSGMCGNARNDLVGRNFNAIKN